MEFGSLDSLVCLLHGSVTFDDNPINQKKTCFFRFIHAVVSKRDEEHGKSSVFHASCDIICSSSSFCVTFVRT